MKKIFSLPLKVIALSLLKPGFWVSAIPPRLFSTGYTEKFYSSICIWICINFFYSIYKNLFKVYFNLSYKCHWRALCKSVSIERDLFVSRLLTSLANKNYLLYLNCHNSKLLNFVIKKTPNQSCWIDTSSFIPSVKIWKCCRDPEGCVCVMPLPA